MMGRKQARLFSPAFCHTSCVLVGNTVERSSAVLVVGQRTIRRSAFVRSSEKTANFAWRSSGIPALTASRNPTATRRAAVSAVGRGLQEGCEAIARVVTHRQCRLDLFQPGSASSGRGIAASNNSPQADARQLLRVPRKISVKGVPPGLGQLGSLPTTVRVGSCCSRALSPAGGGPEAGWAGWAYPFRRRCELYSFRKLSSFPRMGWPARTPEFLHEFPGRREKLGPASEPRQITAP